MVLFAIAAPTMTEERAASLRALAHAGALGGGVLQPDDCRRDYEKLRARDVDFLWEPKEMPYGIEAVLEDDSGNFFSLRQRR